MGLVYAKIELINGGDDLNLEDGYLKPEQVRRMEVDALVDSGSIQLAISEQVCRKLGLRIRDGWSVAMADGSVRMLQVAGPVKIKFLDRDCITQAFVLPGNAETLLGAIPMEAMDLVVIPKSQSLAFNPAHPDGPLFCMK